VLGRIGGGLSGGIKGRFLGCFTIMLNSKRQREVVYIKRGGKPRPGYM